MFFFNYVAILKNSENSSNPCHRVYNAIFNSLNKCSHTLWLHANILSQTIMRVTEWYEKVHLQSWVNIKSRFADVRSGAAFILMQIET